MTATVVERLESLLSTCRKAITDGLYVGETNIYGFSDLADGLTDVTVLHECVTEGLALIVENTKIPPRGSRHYQKTIVKCDKLMEEDDPSFYPFDDPNPVVAMASYAKFLIDMYALHFDPKDLPEARRYRRRFHDFLQSKKYRASRMHWANVDTTQLLRDLVAAHWYHGNHYIWGTPGTARMVFVDETMMINTRITGIQQTGRALARQMMQTLPMFLHDFETRNPNRDHDRFEWLWWREATDNVYGFSDMDDEAA